MVTTTYLLRAATPLLFPLIAVIGATFHARRKSLKLSSAEIWFRWWAIVALGGGGLWMTLSFLFIPDFMSEMIGFTLSPFATEIAFANLGIAVTGFRALKASYRERVTIGIGSGMFLWGATLGHLNQWLANGDTAPGNVGAVLIYDVAIPLLILVFARLSHITKLNEPDKPARGGLAKTRIATEPVTHTP
ncbi:DUF6790 family protein [Psychromicrobium lacuslunae]|uniref:DUF6790 family protein n=1 Tax=Psychromicrobium lacuslunae TaxID=1618207 RepID=UPI0005D40AF7|nr:DUF6790 family protein [Psychromicrobium lacuslunae]